MYMFTTKLLYTNALYAVRDTRPYITRSEFDEFCGILQHAVEEETKDDPTRDGSTRILFDFSDEGYLFGSDRDFKFTELDEYIYALDDAVTDDRLFCENLALGLEGKLPVAFERARREFRDMIAESLNESGGGRYNFNNKTKVEEQW